VTALAIMTLLARGATARKKMSFAGTDLKSLSTAIAARIRAPDPMIFRAMTSLNPAYGRLRWLRLTRQRGASPP
jgi:ABC-type microcin C transport system duplicated ATPase subunit YejF